jgi:hypothetical protein
MAVVDQRRAERDAGEELLALARVRRQRLPRPLCGLEHRLWLGGVDACIGSLGEHHDRLPGMARHDLGGRGHEDVVSRHHGAGPHGHLSTQVLDLGTHQGVGAAAEGLLERQRRALRLTRQPGGLTGREEPPRPVGSLTGELGGAFEGRGRGRVGASLAGAVADSLQRRGDRLVGSEGRRREVPGTPVALACLVEGSGERPVGCAALCGGSGVVGSRADERMAEAQ